LVPSNNVDTRSFSFSSLSGAKETHSLHVSPPGRRPSHVDALMKKSPAEPPVNVSAVTLKGLAPTLVTVSCFGALTVPYGWDSNSRPRTDTRPTGCVTATGGEPAPGPQHATAPSLLTAHV
jgi:hypothetical protein